MLVSCIVLAYNSAKTVIETLESTKNQTYKEIELIVSDDASTDDTVKICQEWIERNKERFVRTELITVNKNTGIAENCNRSISAAKGEWVKTIAADDILLPTCIEDFVDFADKNPDAKWMSSYLRVYNETFEEQNCCSTRRVLAANFFSLSAEGQLRELAFEDCITGPSVFFNHEMLSHVGPFDNQYIIEDWPYFLKILENGFKCYLLTKETVGYRIHKSLSNNADGSIFNYDFEKKVRPFQKDRCWIHLTAKEIITKKIWFLIQDLFQLLNLNKNDGFWNRVYYRICNTLRSLCGRITRSN